MPRGRGGYRKPNAPAAASGPGALSRRTDGGPGAVDASTSAPSQGYGERAAREQIQQAAPMAGNGPSRGGGGQGGPPLGGVADRLFGQSNRPDEPITAGVPMGPGNNSIELLPQDPDVLLAAAYQIYPDPTLLRFMRQFNA